MARKKQTYDAYINTGDEKISVQVTMNDLPYGLFNASQPLVIDGDVDMGAGKSESLPNMENVVINGSFDCSSYKIVPDTILPNGISSLVCLHSISCLDDLVGKLPETVKTVVVRPAILNAIKKAEVSSDEFKSAQEFMKKYPSISVIDGKQNLADIIAEQTKPLDVVKTKIEKQTVVAPVVPEKTSDWLSSDEMISVCMDLSENVSSLSREEIARYVKMARSPKTKLGIKVQQMKREDGDVVVCVHSQDVATVLAFVEAKVAEATAAKSKKEQKKPQEKVVAKPAVADNKEKPKHFFQNREIKAIQIQKYMSKSVWGQIRAKVGNDTGTLLRILQDIQDINVTPAKAHVASGQVAFIKDGNVQVSPTVTFKNGRCLTQGFGTLDDRPRIVWATCGGLFVAQHFFAAHEGKEKLKYNKILREIDVVAEDLVLSDYLLVSDLIKEIGGSRPGSGGSEYPIPTSSTDDSVEDVAPVDSDSAFSGTTDTMEQEVASEEPVVIEPVKPVEVPVAKPVVVPVEAPVAQPKQEPKKVEPKTEKVEPKQDNNPIQWTELYSLHHKYVQRIEFLEKSTRLMLADMAKESDTVKLLKMTGDLTDLLMAKRGYEAALEKMRAINETLKEMEMQLDSKQR